MDLPDWVPAIETKPAPGDLLLLQAFVNTWERDTAIDVLESVSSATPWLVSTGLVSPVSSVTETALTEARAVRESVRALLVHNGSGPAPSPADLEPLLNLAAKTALRPSIERSGDVELQAHPSDDLGLGRLLLIIRDAQRDGTWGRLKACRNGDCRWAYYDRSHAGKGAWCDMATCGNRIKNRTLRSRQRSERSTPA